MPRARSGERVLAWIRGVLSGLGDSFRPQPVLVPVPVRVETPEDRRRALLEARRRAR